MANNHFVRIEAGEFMMGDTLTPEEVLEKYPGGNVMWYRDAHPRHRVIISKPFYMGAYQVTVGEFRQFVNATGYQTTAEKEGRAWGLNKEDNDTTRYIAGLNWRNPGFNQTDQHPVVCVSWYDAQAYVDWMNKMRLPEEAWAKGYRYSLPTEAQWEYACRAGTTTSFFWGDVAADGEGYLNAAGKEGDPNGTAWGYLFPFYTGCKATAPVSSYKPNPWGLYDMLGNVKEWCLDLSGGFWPDVYVTDPIEPDNTSRALRGGGWSNDARGCRSAFRNSSNPARTFDTVGFQLVLVREN